MQKKKKTLKNKGLLGKIRNRDDKHKYKIGFYYSFLTLVLIICLIQILVSAILNITKTISYKSKIATITKTLEEAKLKNQRLKEEIKTLSSNQNIELEAIARNTLKMSENDEVLVIINPKPVTNTETDKNKRYKKMENKQ